MTLTATLVDLDPAGKTGLINFAEPCNIPIGKQIVISLKKSKRSLQQNKFYFAFLQWCIIKGGLNRYGHFSVDALHEDIKEWARDTHKTEYKGDFSTADLSILAFADYFNMVERELMNGFFLINTAPFMTDYEGFAEWRSMQNDPESCTFKEYLLQKA